MDQTAYPILAISARSGRIFNLFASHDAPLIKADGAIPPGARWITVKPNGDAGKGVPVLIQETSPGSGVHRVVGGAGGKLNYLRLKGVKSEAQYRQEHASKQQAKKAEKAAQRKRDKELGLTGEKKAAKQAIKSEKVNQEQEYIKTVADALGWTDHEFDPEPYQDLSVRAQSAAFQKHHRETLKRANEAVKLHEQQLMADGEARAQALGETPLESDDPETIALADLDPEPTGGGLGYAPAWKQQAEAKAGGSDVIKAEKEAVEAAEPEEKRDAKAKRKATAEALKAELETVRDPTPKEQEKVLVDVEKTVAMLKAKKQLALAKKKLADASRKVDEAKTDPHAYVIEVDGPDEKALTDAVKADIKSDLRTLKTRAFLSEVEKSGGEVAKDFGVGAYNSLNSIALTATGASLLDRQVVDALGVAGASQVLAKRLRDSLTPEELEDLQDGLQSFHMEHYMDASDKAMGEAARLQAAAEAITLDAASNGHDLAKMQELNAQRRDSIAHARRILSTTLGEMEANAAMLVALKQGDKTSIEVPLGKMGIEDAIIRARAIGLDRGDYSINSVGSERFLTITAMDKLTAAVDAEDLAITRRAMRIMDGHEDEEGWLPKGVADRPDLAAKPSPGVAPRLAEPLAFTGTAEDAVRDYIGGRAADGDHPRDIVADLLSQDFKRKADDAGQGAAYQAAIDKLAPLKDADGKLLQPEDHAEAFEAMAQAFSEKRYGGKLAPLHRQNIAVDQVSVDALHRALAAEPSGVLAFKDLGDLTRKDQKALRDWWWQAVGKKDEAAAGLRADLDAHAQREPEKEIEDMFGDRVTAPEWEEWKAKRDDLAEQLGAAGLDWNKYASVMGGHGKAYEAVQDLIRSKVAKGFHEAHNTLRPGEPVKLGRSSIRNNLAHLDAVDPDVRERRIAEHRELIDGLRERGAGGQYASGSVFDKIDEAREQRAAFEQSQMGLFGSDDMFGDTGDMFGGDAAPEKPLEADQRYTIGHAAERTLAGMVQTVGQNFRPGKPTQLWSASMSGKYVNQQRACRLVESSKKVALAAGVGSGKSLIGLGSFSDLHAKGKVKRGLFLVPSPVQSQMGGEALRYLRPGEYKWHAEAGASREERMAAYRDPETHFNVVTHQAFRDDMVHLAAEKDGITKQDAAAKIQGMSFQERKAYMREVMDHAGIDHDFCLPGDTEVMVSGGSMKYLRDIVESCSGVRVVSVDVMSGAVSDCEVVGRQKIKNKSGILAEIKTSSRGVRCTIDHKVWVAGKGYVEACLIAPGDAVAVGFHACHNALFSAGKEYDDQEHACRDGSRRRLHHQAKQQGRKDCCQAFVETNRLCASQVRAAFRRMQVTAKGERERGIWGQAGILCDKLSSLVKRISRYGLVGWEAGHWGWRSGSLDGGGSGVLVHGRWGHEWRRVQSLDIPIQQRGSGEGQGVDFRPVLGAVFGATGQGARAVQHSHAKSGLAGVYEDNCSARYPKHAVQAGRRTPGIRGAGPGACAGSVVRGLWRELRDQGCMLSRFLHQGGGFSQKQRVVCEKQGCLQSAARRGERKEKAAEAVRVLRQFVCSCVCRFVGMLTAVQGGHQKETSDGKVLFEEVTSVTFVSDDSDVYDITVADNHNFFANGILVSNCFIDESHDSLSRAGKRDSLLANVFDGVSHNMEYQVRSSADPIKNDSSEIFALLHSLDPDRFSDSKAFMRKYGVDTPASKAALKREMARYLFPASIDSGVKADERVEHVKLTDAQHAAISAIDKAAARVRLARMRGTVDVEAARTLSPNSFEGVDPGQHDAVAKKLAGALGAIKESATRRAINAHDGGAKVEAVSKLAADRKGKPGVVFARSLDAVKQIAERLKGEGHRVAVITGEHTGKEKDKARLAFNPESGEAEADILVASDAAAVGLNLQRGQWLAQVDISDTAKTHRQRQGRINRLGQKNNVELIDLVADHPAERRARERLRKKDDLRGILTSPMSGLDDTGLAAHLNQARVKRQQGDLF